MNSAVAVVGAGVAGLTAAHVLQRRYRVTLFDAEPRPGGHACTVDVSAAEGTTLPMDVGFMVYNSRNYPNLMRLFAELDIATQGSDMSMSLTCERCSLTYLAGSTLRSLPRRPREVGSFDWGRIERDMRRFTDVASRVSSDTTDSLTIGTLLKQEGFSTPFAEHLVLPLVSALWSCGTAGARDYPARYLYQFLDNHGMLPGGDATRWRTVVGGSRAYVSRLVDRLDEVCLGLPVRSVRRVAEGVEVRDATDAVRLFDRAVVAVHADQALRLLADVTAEEKAVLGAIPYVANETVLHTDSSLLPADPSIRASWNVRRTRGAESEEAASITYHLNRLQRIPADIDYLVTLNPRGRVAEESVLARLAFEHPVYSPRSVRARALLPSLNSPRLAFAGAYHGWAFHEDGCVSGVRAAEALGGAWE
jgi:predicted NAD/FAD-binding protein